MRFIFFLTAIVFVTPCGAQSLHDSVRPRPGEETVVAVGEEVYQKSRYTSLPAYEVLRNFDGKNVFAHVYVSAGDKFMPIPSKAKLKACRSPSLEAFQQQLYNACLYDDDGDGTFDRFGANEVQGGKKIDGGLPYRETEYIEPTKDSLKQVVIYLGSTKDSLRLSYREFVNDMARPAFTEEYTFPLGPTFPQIIAFKGVKMSVSAIDGEGMHYVLK